MWPSALSLAALIVRAASLRETETNRRYTTYLWACGLGALHNNIELLEIDLATLLPPFVIPEHIFRIAEQ